MLPLVSIYVLAYNHEMYIATCIESILMQKTAFPFEIVIGEDCSTDGTLGIVRDYAERYPNTIRVVTSPENVGALRNSARVRKVLRGKYFAICEGDDYWIDPLKLEKQVTFMEMHPDFSMCFHDALVLSDGKNSPPRYFCPKGLPQVVTMETVIIEPWFIPTASILGHTYIAQSVPQGRIAGDMLLALWCGHHGNLGYMRDTMSVYRQHPGGLSVMTSLDAMYRDQVFAYSLFDQETSGKYADLIEQKTKRIARTYRECRLRRRLGYAYFAIRPGVAIRKLRESLRH